MSKPGKPPVFDGKAEAWPDWKSSMQAHLNSKDILDPLVEERPGQAVPGREWDRKRSKIHSELTLYTEGAARGIVRQYERRRGAEPALDGKGAWAALVAKYEHQGMAALVSVEQALDRLTLGSGRDPDLFFGKFEELCDRLDGQQPEAPDGVDPAVVAAREAARDKARVAKVLAKLPSEYGQLVMLLEAVDGLTYDVAIPAGAATGEVGCLARRQPQCRGAAFPGQVPPLRQAGASQGGLPGQACGGCQRMCIWNALCRV